MFEVQIYFAVELILWGLWTTEARRPRTSPSCLPETEILLISPFRPPNVAAMPLLSAVGRSTSTFLWAQVKLVSTRGMALVQMRYPVQAVNAQRLLDQVRTVIQLSLRVHALLLFPAQILLGPFLVFGIFCSFQNTGTALPLPSPSPTDSSLSLGVV